MLKKPIENETLYEEPVCVTIGADTDAVICDSYTDSGVEDYDRQQFEW